MPVHFCLCRPARRRSSPFSPSVSYPPVLLLPLSTSRYTTAARNLPRYSSTRSTLPPPPPCAPSLALTTLSRSSPSLTPSTPVPFPPRLKLAPRYYRYCVESSAQRSHTIILRPRDFVSAGRAKARHSCTPSAYACTHACMYVCIFATLPSCLSLFLFFLSYSVS